MSGRTRSLFGVGVAAVLVAIGAQALGTSPAVADSGGLAGAATCQADGTYTVTWQLVNDRPDPVSFTVTSVTPAGASAVPRASMVPADGSVQIVETGAPGSARSATITVELGGGGGSTSRAAAVPLAPGCGGGHVAVAPSGRDGYCDSYDRSPIGPSITVPSDPGVGYEIDGSPEAAGRHPVTPGTHTVSASSSQFPLAGQTSWTFHLAAPPEGCGGTVTPVTPLVTQSGCGADSTTATAPTLQVQYTANVAYSVAPAGPYRAGESVLVMAAAGSGYAFRPPAPSGWSYLDPTHETYRVTFADAPGCVRATAPGFGDGSCQDGAATEPTVIIPSTAGVDYVLDARSVTSGTHPARSGSTVVVAATSRPGYRLVGPTTWTHHFPALPTCARTVVPAGPGFVAGYCNGGPTPISPSVDIPSLTGVEYRIGGVAVTPGPHPARPGETVTVVAVARAGYVLGGVTAWRHTFARADPAGCTVRLVAAAPRFDDADCASPNVGHYTIPSASGLSYAVNGAGRSPGRYAAAPGTTAKVAVTAQRGYVLVGVTRWTHSFPTTAPTCATPPGRSARGPATPAMTGPPTGPLLVAGSLMLLVGVACCRAGRARAAAPSSVSTLGVPSPGRAEAVIRAPVAPLAAGWSAGWSVVASSRLQRLLVGPAARRPAGTGARSHRRRPRTGWGVDDPRRQAWRLDHPG